MTTFRDVVRADLRRVAADETPVGRKLAVIWREMGAQAVIVYRFGQLLRSAQRQVLLWPLLPCGWALYGFAILVIRRGYGIRLSLTAEIGPGFYVGHFGGVEVANCRIGERCSVGQQTKVSCADGTSGPQIGNRVSIGAHARILGPLRIGDDTTIAPGARVTRDVPNGALVAGDPGRIVFRSHNRDPIPHRA